MLKGVIQAMKKRKIFEKYHKIIQFGNFFIKKTERTERTKKKPKTPLFDDLNVCADHGGDGNDNNNDNSVKTLLENLYRDSYYIPRLAKLIRTKTVLSQERISSWFNNQQSNSQNQQNLPQSVQNKSQSQLPPALTPFKIPVFSDSSAKVQLDGDGDADGGVTLAGTGKKRKQPHPLMTADEIYNHRDENLDNKHDAPVNPSRILSNYENDENVEKSHHKKEINHPLKSNTNITVTRRARQTTPASLNTNVNNEVVPLSPDLLEGIDIEQNEEIATIKLKKNEKNEKNEKIKEKEKNTNFGTSGRTTRYSTRHLLQQQTDLMTDDEEENTHTHQDRRSSRR